MAAAHTSIAGYGVIGDGRSAALISCSGSIDWLCWPRFDSPSIFGRLLDFERGGHWHIAPAAPAAVIRRYVVDTNILETRFQAKSGEVVLTDFMPVAAEEEKRRQLWPEHELLRQVVCSHGEVDVDVDFMPQPDYDRRPTVVRDMGALGYRLELEAAIITLNSAIPLAVSPNGLKSRIRLRAGESVSFSLTYSAEGPAVLPPLDGLVAQKLDLTARWWKQWAARSRYDGPYRDLVVRSALVLKLLSFAPSGAIVAAPTTSLPEVIGGSLNWDYRYCWLRDAAFTVRAFLSLGYHDEAEAFLSWLLHATRLTQPRLKVLYDVYGNRPPKEAELGHWSGHFQSRPVRVGNAADEQVQLDVYGEIVDAAAALVEAGHTLDRETQHILARLGEYVCTHWHEADNGIWESRKTPENYTHSRLMCWVALDRLIAMHRNQFIQRIPMDRFTQHARAIKAQLQQQAWNKDIRAYTQILGGERVDASALLIAIHGFEDASSIRMTDTWRRLRTQLCVRRGLLYRNEDSAAAGEGAFVMCGFWLADFMTRGGGSLPDAREAFETICGYANDLGLLAEELDPRTGQALGNFPQAFSHVGLIHGAVSLAKREQREPAGRKAIGHASVPPG